MKNMLYLLLALTLCLSACKKDEECCHKTILFKNNSTKAVYIQASGSYPDTLSFDSEFPSPALNPDLYKVDQSSQNDRGLGRRDCYELAFDNNIIPSETLVIFVFDAEVLESNSWQQVARDYLVIKRYDLSLKDLEDLEWTISYP